MHKHSENCVFCNVFKVAETVEQKLDKLQSDINQAIKSILGIKKQNDETVKKMTEILEKIGYKRVLSQSNKPYFSKEDQISIFSNHITLETAYFYSGIMICGLPDGKILHKIEKELFDKGLDEEFTILEAQLNKQFKNAKKIHWGITQKIPTQLADILSEKFPEIKTNYYIHQNRLISDYYEHLSIDLGKDLKKQVLNIIKNYK